MKISLVKKLICGSLLCAVCFPVMGQNTHPRLIVRADDMGSFQSSNVACMEGFKNGIETSICDDRGETIINNFTRHRRENIFYHLCLSQKVWYFSTTDVKSKQLLLMSCYPAFQVFGLNYENMSFSIGAVRCSKSVRV